MSPRVICFGEVLWDCLPAMRLPGGAPLNVAYHLRKQGLDPIIVSAVGCDALGDEMLSHLERCGLDTGFVRRHPSMPTGTVPVTLDHSGQPSYVITENVAWDEIAADVSLPAADAIVFGSLAARSEANRAALENLLKRPAIVRLMDVNLRAPFDDHARVLNLARHADWLKLNIGELAALTGIDCEGDPSNGMRELTSRTGVKHICVTAGERGAWLVADGETHFSPTPPVRVADTVGAGDAFTAALLAGVLRGDPLSKVLRAACHLGALVASLPGGQPEYDPEASPPFTFPVA